jgi:hypothetical protein
MGTIITPAGATDEQIDRFIASLRREARTRVRQMLAEGAPEDEVVDYITGLEDAEPESAIDTTASDPTS